MNSMSRFASNSSVTFSSLVSGESNGETRQQTLGIWLVREEALTVGHKLQHALGGDLFKPWELTEGSQRLAFQTCFKSRSHWILIMAVGIAVRFIDGLLSDKKTDPAVVVVDEGGHYAISLLSGHEGGANDLAFIAGNVLNAVPVVSTATEAKKSLIAGIGCRKGVSEEQIDACLRSALSGRDINSIRVVATIDLKAKEAGLLSFCQRKNLPLQIFDRECVAARAWSSKPSEWVRQNIGSDGVCEPCALMVSPRGRLVVPKTTLDGVAVALVDDSLRI